jgi:hypothetical protein
MARRIKYTTTALAVAKKETKAGQRLLTSAGARPPYICVHGPYGGCLRYDYNSTLDIYGPSSTQVDCATCKYF